MAVPPAPPSGPGAGQRSSARRTPSCHSAQSQPWAVWLPLPSGPAPSPRALCSAAACGPAPLTPSPALALFGASLLWGLQVGGWADSQLHCYPSALCHLPPPSPFCPARARGLASGQGWAGVLAPRPPGPDTEKGNQANTVSPHLSPWAPSPPSLHKVRNLLCSAVGLGLQTTPPAGPLCGARVI